MTRLSSLWASFPRKATVGAGPELPSPHLAGPSHLRFLSLPVLSSLPQRQRLGPSVLASLHLQLLTLSVLFSLALNVHRPSAVLKNVT